MSDNPKATDPSDPSAVDSRDGVVSRPLGESSATGSQLPLAQILNQMNFAGTAAPPEILQKVTPEHISKTLEIAQSEQGNRFLFATRQQQISASNRWFAFGVFALTIFVVLVLVFGLQDRPEVLTPVLTGIFGLAAGALGGYGFARARGSQGD